MSSRLELRLVVSKAIRRSIIARVAGLMAVGSAFRVADTSRGYSRLWPAGSRGAVRIAGPGLGCRSEEHTSELQSLMRISYAVFCLKKKIHLVVRKLTVHEGKSRDNDIRIHH